MLPRCPDHARSDHENPPPSTPRCPAARPLPRPGHGARCGRRRCCEWGGGPRAFERGGAAAWVRSFLSVALGATPRRAHRSAAGRCALPEQGLSFQKSMVWRCGLGGARAGSARRARSALHRARSRHARLRVAPPSGACARPPDAGSRGGCRGGALRALAARNAETHSAKPRPARSRRQAARDPGTRYTRGLGSLSTCSKTWPLPLDRPAGAGTLKTTDSPACCTGLGAPRGRQALYVDDSSPQTMEEPGKRSGGAQSLARLTVAAALDFARAARSRPAQAWATHRPQAPPPAAPSRTERPPPPTPHMHSIQVVYISRRHCELRFQALKGSTYCHLNCFRWGVMTGFEVHAVCLAHTKTYILRGRRIGMT